MSMVYNSDLEDRFHGVMKVNEWAGHFVTFVQLDTCRRVSIRPSSIQVRFHSFLSASEAADWDSVICFSQT